MFCPLVDLGEGVEEAPQVPGAELAVLRFAPLHDHVGHLARGDRPAVGGADDEVVGAPVLRPHVPNHLAALLDYAAYAAHLCGMGEIDRAKV